LGFRQPNVRAEAARCKNGLAQLTVMIAMTIATIGRLIKKFDMDTRL
jgi:hypothetical protein